MWAAEGQLTEAKRWNRAKLAAQARNYSLANSLVQGLTTLGPQGRLLIDVAQKPELLNQPSRFTPVNEAMSDVVSLGLRRLARQDLNGPWRCSTITPSACTSPATRRLPSPARSA